MYKAIGMDRVLEVVTASPGTGAVTLGGAVSGFRTFASVMGTGDTCPYFVETVDANGVPTGPWERGFGTLAAGPSLARTMILDSSAAGAAVNFSAPLRIGSAPMTEIALMYPVPGGRFGMDTAGALPDGSGATITYWPYVHDRITLWNGYGFQVASIPLTGVAIGIGSTTNGQGYDLYAYITPAGGLSFDAPYAWTNANTRPGLVYSNGILCKPGDPTRRYMGSFYSYGGMTYDVQGASGVSVPGRRMLWNMYNRVQKVGYVYDNTTSWSYAGSSWRICRGVAAPNNSVEIFRGRDEDGMFALSSLTGQSTANSGLFHRIGVGGALPPFTTIISPLQEVTGAGNMIGCCVCSFAQQLGIGYFILNLFESTNGLTVNLGANAGGTAQMNVLVTC